MASLLFRQAQTVLLIFCLAHSALTQDQSVEQLVSALIEAKSSQERAALLDARKDLITVDLQKSLLGRGDGFFNQRKWQPATGAYEAMREVALRLADKTGQAVSLNKIGVTYFRQNRFEQALSYHQQSLTLRKELGIPDDIVQSLTNLAQVHLRLSNYDVALEHLNETRPLLDSVKDKTQAASVLNTLGSTYRLIGNYTEALATYQQALKIYQAANSQEGIAGSQLNMGITYQELGDAESGVEFAQRVLALSEAQQNKPLTASALNNIGSAYYLRGNHSKAMEFFEKSLRLKQELGDDRGVATTLGNIGNIYHRQGNSAQALSYYQKALEIRQRIDDRWSTAFLFNSIGQVYSDQSDYVKAAEFHQQGLQIGEELKNDAVIAETGKKLGMVYQQQGRRAEALKAIERSLALERQMGSKREIVDSLAALAGFYLSGNQHSEAIKFAEQAYALAKEINYTSPQQETLNLLGKIYISLGQVDKAKQAFTQAINLTETLRLQAAGGEQERQRTFEKSVTPYYSMVQLSAMENDPTAALAYAERGKARVLLDVLQSGNVNISKAMTADEKQQAQALKIAMVSLNTQFYRESQSEKPNPARLSELKSRLQKARLEYEAFQDKLYAAHNALKTQRGEVTTFTVEEAGSLLTDAQTALLEYVVSDGAVYLFVLSASAAPATPNRLQKPVLRLYDLKIKRPELIEQVRKLNQRIANNDLEYADLAGNLYNLLIAPAREQLQGKSRLVIVPDDILWETPFQALRSPNGRFLIQSAAISYAPSLTVLREINKTRKPKSATTLFAMGNPKLASQATSHSTRVLMNDNLAPLPDAERLVKELALIYGAKNSKVYVGAEAREDLLKAEAANYRLLQLATHGVMNNNSPMYSHIVLAQSSDSKEDGLLEAWEIMQMDLQADLAVLSACETARGRIGAGEGVMGLSWALFVAGCPTTVVSQWKVESQSTTELMLGFHRGLQAGAGKSEALRQAALKLMANKKFNHPFYWAGFIVVGDGF